jgi:hypothetical protein
MEAEMISVRTKETLAIKKANMAKVYTILIRWFINETRC